MATTSSVCSGGTWKTPKPSWGICEPPRSGIRGSAWCLWSCLWAARAAAGLNGEWAPEEFGCASIVETTETMHDRKLLTLAELPDVAVPNRSPLRLGAAVFCA